MKLRGIKRVRSKGRLYRYHRVSGIELPRDMPEDDPRFLEAYLDAERSIGTKAPEAAHGPGSLDDLITRYLRSFDFNEKMRASSRVGRSSILERIRVAYGHVKVATLRPVHIRRDLGKVSQGAQRSRRSAWRALDRFALRAGDREDPFTTGVALEGYRAKPHASWPPDAISAFREKWPHGTVERVAFEVLYWTGARVSDGVRLGWPMVDRDGWLVYRQTKTEGEAVVPVREVLVPDLESDRAHFLTAIAGAETVWITTHKGAGRSVKGLSNMIRHAGQAAGLTGLSAHGLRKARSDRLKEAGLSVDRRAAWTGHENMAQAESYSRAADLKRVLRGTDPEQKVENQIAQLGKPKNK